MEKLYDWGMKRCQLSFRYPGAIFRSFGAGISLWFRKLQKGGEVLVGGGRL